MKKAFLFFAFITTFFSLSLPVHAETYTCVGNGRTASTHSSRDACNAACTGAGYSCVETSSNNNNQSSGPVTLSNPLGSESSPQRIIGRVINFSLGFVGSLALLMFIYGGFVWMTSSGNQERVEQGKKTLIWATAGLALIFFSYALVNFIIYQGILGQPSPASQDQPAPGLDPGGEIGGG